jgi:hypothetical protein
MTTPVDDERRYGSALDRMARIMLVLGAAGALGAWCWRGWPAGLGFALGAGASWLNYRWLKQIAEAVGGGGKLRGRTAVLAGLRYLLMAAGAYVILCFSAVSLTAALAGLFVAVGAAIAEILFELMYGRN